MLHVLFVDFVGSFVVSCVPSGVDPVASYVSPVAYMQVKDSVA